MTSRVVRTSWCYPERLQTRIALRTALSCFCLVWSGYACTMHILPHSRLPRHGATLGSHGLGRSDVARMGESWAELFEKGAGATASLAARLDTIEVRAICPRACHGAAR